METDPAQGRRWPLHPKPREWEVLETWVRRIAAAYGIGYDTFLRRALGRTGRGARYLAEITDVELARLAAGTGVPVGRLHGMSTGAILGRMTASIQNRMLTEEGREELDQLNVTLGLMVRRAADERANDCHTISR